MSPKTSRVAPVWTGTFCDGYKVTHNRAATPRSPSSACSPSLRLFPAPRTLTESIRTATQTLLITACSVKAQKKTKKVLDDLRLYCDRDGEDAMFKSNHCRNETNSCYYQALLAKNTELWFQLHVSVSGIVLALAAGGSTRFPTGVRC